MTTPKAISFVAFLLIAGLSLSFIMGGVWFNNVWQARMNTLMALKTYNVLGFFKVPFVNIDFFTVGIPRLLSFDFAFFGGSTVYFQYILYAVSIGIIWGFVSVVIGIIYNFWSKAR